MTERYPDKTPREGGFFRFFIRQKEMLNIVFLGVIITGTILALRITKEAFGSFDFDLVTVTTAYPGATAEEVEQLVTNPLEAALKTVEGIDEMSSTSAEGISAIVLQLDPDAPENGPILRDIEQEVDRIAADDLPEESETPLVQEVTSAFPILTIAVSGDVPDLRLREVADQLEDDLLDIPGVSRVAKSGFLEREMWVEATPDALRRHHVSLNDLIRAVREGDVNVPGGRVEIGGDEIAVRAVGRLKSVDDVAAVVVRSNELGRNVRVGDVATLSDRTERRRQITRVNGRPSIQVQVLKKQSGDTLVLDKAIKSLVGEYTRRFDGEVAFDFADETAFYIERRLEVLLSNGAIGMTLVLIVMFIFLSPNSAFWTTTSIPFAFLGGLITIWLMGYSINLITMFAFILVSGMLVDTGVVISEHIERRREDNVHPFTAVSEGVSDMALPVLASVATTVIAFAPLGFMSGIVGKFLRQMPIVLVACLTADLLEGLFVLPSHLYHYQIRPRVPRPLEAVRRRAQRGLEWVTNRYGTVVRWVVRHPFGVTGIFLALLVTLGAISRAVVRFQLFPVGVEEFTVAFELPIGTSLDRTREVALKMESVIEELPPEKVDAVISYIGSAPPQGPVAIDTVGTHAATLRVIFDQTKLDRNGDEMIESIRLKLQAIADDAGVSEFSIERLQGGPPTGRAIDVRLMGPSFDALEEVSTEAQAFLREIDGVIGVKDDYDAGKEEIQLQIDRAAVARAGLTSAGVANAVRAAVDGVEATEIRREGEDDAIAIVIKLEERFRENGLAALDDLFLTDPQGRLIPLDSLVNRVRTTGPLAIQHLRARRTITVSADVNPDVVTSREANARLDAFLRDRLDDRPRIDYEFGGEEEDRRESMQSLFEAMGISLLLIYIVLTALFRSYFAPMAIISVIPFALIGVLLTLILHGLPMSLLVLVGFAGLMGVVVNNSILMIETFRWHEEASESDAEASVIKGSTQRLRPIVITSLTTLLAVLPLGYGIGGSEPFLEDMALTFGWGLFFCSGVTLFWIPSVYMTGVRVKRFVRARRK